MSDYAEQIEHLKTQIAYEQERAQRMKEANALSDENKFWIWIWSIVAAAFISLVAGITTYNIYEAGRVAEMVKTGKNPIEIQCALGNVSSHTCTVLATARIIEAEKQK
jgi:hypothetical protein